MGLSKENNSAALMRLGFSGMFFFLPVATTPTVICEIFLICVWLTSGKFLRDIPVLLKSDMMIPLLMLMFLPWAGMIYTPVPREGLNVAFSTYYWLSSIMLMSLLQPAIKLGDRNNTDADTLIKMFLFGLAVNSTIAVLQFFGLAPLKRGAPIGLLGGDSAHIPFSLFLTLGIMMSSFYFLKAGTWKIRFMYAFFMVQFFVTISFIGARSGYVALIVLSPLIVYNVMGRRHLFTILTGCIIIISLLFASPVVQSRVSKVKEDLLQYRHGNVNTSIGLRFHMWEIAFMEIKNNPLIGKGTAGFLDSWERYKKDRSLPVFIHGNPHNSFLYMTVSFGIFGLISFCWVLLIMLRNGWEKRITSLGFTVLVFTIIFFIASLVDTPLLSISAAKAFSLFVGIAGAINES